MSPEDENEKKREGVKEARRRYVKLAEFGLPESPYETVKQILRAMGKLGGPDTPLTNQQTADTSGFTSRVVSGNNRFLLASGVAERIGNKMALTDRGAKLALALDYSDAVEAGRLWRSLVAENEFLKRVLGALDIKGGMSHQEFAQYIARTAGAPNEPQFLRGAGTVIDVLLEAELIKEAEGDALRVTPEYRTLEMGEGLEEIPVQEPSRGFPRKRGLAVEGVQLRISVAVTITPDTTKDDVETIGDRILELRKKVTESQEQEHVHDSS